MKVWENILKVVAALIAAAGIIYVIITYGDKIVAWVKKLFSKEVILYEGAEDVDVIAEDEEPVAEEGDFEAAPEAE